MRFEGKPEQKQENHAKRDKEDWSQNNQMMKAATKSKTGPRKVSTKEAEPGETGTEPRRDCMQQAPTCGTARTTVKGTGSPRPRVRDKPNPRAETKLQLSEERIKEQGK